jgi:hypothetical protein
LIGIAEEEEAEYVFESRISPLREQLKGRAYCLHKLSIGLDLAVENSTVLFKQDAEEDVQF